MALAATYDTREDLGYSEFVSILTHDDRDSRYVLARLGEGGTWSEHAATAGELAGYEPALWPFDDTYLTVNGFNGRRRLQERCRQVNALSFDIDAHGAIQAPLEAICDAIDAAVADGALPKPTMTVATGRGLQIHYVLRRSIPYRRSCEEEGRGVVNEKAMGYLSDVRSLISAALDEAVAGVEGAENDRSVSDLARVVRVPGTFNTKAGAFARLLSADAGLLYSLDELKASTSASSRANIPSKRPGRAKVVRFDSLLLHRAKKLEELRDLRDRTPKGTRCTDRARNNMLFVYYNTLVQVYERESAAEMARAYNQGFAQPLPDAEVSAVIRSVDRNGAYRLSARKIVEKLCATAEEIEAVGLFASRRQSEREAAKARTREKRAARNAAVLALLDEGLSQGQAAGIVGISRQTVNKIAQAARAGKPAARKLSLADIARELVSQRAHSAKRDLSIFLAHVLSSAVENLLQPSSEEGGFPAGVRKRRPNAPPIAKSA